MGPPKRFTFYHEFDFSRLEKTLEIEKKKKSTRMTWSTSRPIVGPTRLGS